MATEKQYVELWEEYRDSMLNARPAEKNETPKQQRDRIARLETPGNHEEWIAYYFYSANSAKPNKFHLNADSRVINNAEWYEVRMWSRELAKSTRTFYEAMYLVLVGHPPTNERPYRLKKKYMIMFSASLKAAEKLLIPYKAAFEFNERLKNDYGNQQRLGSWTSEKFTIKDGATFEAYGPDGAPRGSKTKDGDRPDLMAFDDIDTDEDCRNPTQIIKKWKWVEEAAIGTRSINVPTIIIFCGNRIAVDCCVVRASKFADKTEIINITDAKGNPTWPEKNTKKSIERVLSQKSYAGVQKEYYNNPIVEGSVFKEMAYKKSPFIGHFSHLVCYTDPSFKDTAKNDYKATVLVGKYRDEFHVIKAFVDQTTTAKMIDWHYQIMDIVGGRSCYYYMEEVFLQELLITEFYKTSHETGRTIPIMGDKRTKDNKFMRIESLLEPLHRNGKLWLNEDNKDDLGMKKLDEQFIAFAAGSRAHDDGPDAVEGAVWQLLQKGYKMTAGEEIIMTGKSRSKNHY